MERTDAGRSQRSIPQALLWVVVALVAIRVLTTLFWKGDVKELIEWVPIEQAQRQAMVSGKPIMYDFTAAWCGPCRSLEAAVWRDRKSAEQINRRVVPVRVVDRKQEDGRNPVEVEGLQNRFNVRAFPTIVFVDARGEVRERMEGYRGREAFFDVLTAAVKKTPPRQH